jgi:hypothetical protein
MKVHYGASTEDGRCATHQELEDGSDDHRHPRARAGEAEVGMLAPSGSGQDWRQTALGVTT